MQEFVNWLSSRHRIFMRNKRLHTSKLGDMYNTKEWEEVRAINKWVNIYNPGDDFVKFLEKQKKMNERTRFVRPWPYRSLYSSWTTGFFEIRTMALLPFEARMPFKPNTMPLGLAAFGILFSTQLLLLPSSNLPEKDAHGWRDFVERHGPINRFGCLLRTIDH